MHTSIRCLAHPRYQARRAPRTRCNVCQAMYDDERYDRRFLDPFIYEMPIYDGALKNWRVLNCHTGTFYSTEFETLEQALKSIKTGEDRSGLTVRLLTLPVLNGALTRCPP